jgi:ABC-type bacteriocin/lantibiotic exporter with double-glycine peptidase domain
MHVLLYWLVRTAIFLLVFAVLWALGWFDVFAVLFAVIPAWALSYIAFPRLRRRAAEQMDGWISRSRSGIEADAGEEDKEADALPPRGVADGPAGT